MEWPIVAALITVVAGLFGLVANNSLSVSRERRKEFNDLAVPIREALTKEVANPSPFFAGPTRAQLDRLIASQPIRRRGACDRAAREYEERYRDNIKQEAAYGSAYLEDTEKVRAAAAKLLSFTAPR